MNDVKRQENSVSQESLQGRWTKQEHMLFVQALQLYGKHWKLVGKHVGNRSSAQLRSHAQKFFNRLERELEVPINKLKSHDIKEFFKKKLPEFRSYKNAKIQKISNTEVIREPKIRSIEQFVEPITLLNAYSDLSNQEEQYALQVMELQELLQQRFLLLTLLNNLSQFNTPLNNNSLDSNLIDWQELLNQQNNFVENHNREQISFQQQENVVIRKQRKI